MIRFGPLTLREQDWFEGWEVSAGVNTTAQTPLDDVPSGDALSETPLTLSATVKTRERMGAVRGAELQSLLTSKGMQPFAVATPGIGDEGYYIANGETRRSDISSDGEDRTVNVPVDVVRVATQSDHWLAASTERVQVDHEYGNDVEPVIGIPAASTKRRWYNPDTGAVAVAGQPVETHAAEHGSIELYSLDAGETAVGAENATLLYELPYREAGVVDPVVWDGAGAGYGESHGDDYGGLTEKIDEDGVRQWQHVFSTSHEFGVPVLDNGLLRVYAREAAGELSAEEWNPDSEAWESVGLDWSGTDWELFDVDVEAITPVADRFQATFLHPDDGLYALDAALHRGWPNVQWSVAGDEDPPIPSELESVLEPVASMRLLDAQPQRELVRRGEVRR